MRFCCILGTASRKQIQETHTLTVVERNNEGQLGRMERREEKKERRETKERTNRGR